MKREIFYSILLHVFVVFLAVVATPFDMTKRFEGEIIRVRTVSIPYSAPAGSPEPVAVEQDQPETPTIVADEPEDIPITDPSKKTEQYPEQKKEEKPKPKPPPQAADDQRASKPASPDSPTGEPGTGGAGTEVSAGTGEGSPFGTASVDNASFNYPYWFTQTFNKIARNWRQTISIDGTVVCVVYFQVIKSGRMIELKVDQSSGVPQFDQTCLSAVERASPFPPLPDEFRDEIIGITLPFKYEPR